MSGAERSKRWRKQSKAGRRTASVSVDAVALAAQLVADGYLPPGDEDCRNAADAALERMLRDYAAARAVLVMINKALLDQLTSQKRLSCWDTEDPYAIREALRSVTHRADASPKHLPSLANQQMRQEGKRS